MTSISEFNDEYLIQQFVEGDLQAFDSLYNRHIKAVYRRVSFAVPETDIEDVTQEIFLAALRSLGTFRGDAQFSTWLRKLTKNKVAEYYRKRSRKKETMQVDLIYAEQVGDHSNTGNLEDRIALRRALRLLPEHYQEVILLRFAEDMQFSEIAEYQNQKIEATKSLFRRAMSALRNELEDGNE